MKIEKIDDTTEIAMVELTTIVMVEESIDNPT
jgi:hypothetical protein